MGVALVFSGQGHQHPAMLPWLAEGPALAALRAALGVADWRALLADPAAAAVNVTAQQLLTGTALAAWAELAPRLPPPVAVAGYSVGELAAFAAAGVMEADVALDLARRRALAMDRCAAREPGGLLGVSTLPATELNVVCAQAGVEVAIRNAPDVAVVGGPRAALDAAERLATARGARCTRLAVNVASHTSWMADAADTFAEVLRGIALRPPRTALFGNIGGRVRSADDAAQALSRQIACTVQWADTMEELCARAPRCVLEIGPGQALARLWNQRHPGIPARSCDEFRSVAAIERWVRSHG